MGRCQSGHNGAVLKTGEYFGSRFSIFPVFSTGRGCKKLRENRDFSPSFSPFFRETLEREYIWRCTQAVEGTGLENREVGIENRRGGSNPSISASQSNVRFALIFYLPHQEITFKAPRKPFVKTSLKPIFVSLQIAFLMTWKNKSLLFLSPDEKKICRKMTKSGDKDRFICYRFYHLLKSLDLGGYTNDSCTGHSAISWHYKMLQRL